jgi:hypothetical protein
VRVWKRSGERRRTRLLCPQERPGQEASRSGRRTQPHGERKADRQTVHPGKSPGCLCAASRKAAGFADLMLARRLLKRRIGIRPADHQSCSAAAKALLMTDVRQCRSNIADHKRVYQHKTDKGAIQGRRTGHGWRLLQHMPNWQCGRSIRQSVNPSIRDTLSWSGCSQGLPLCFCAANHRATLANQGFPTWRPTISSSCPVTASAPK